MKVKRIIRTFSLFLVCVILMTMLPFNAHAEFYDDIYRDPRAYIKDLKITTDMAEVCQTGNLARSVDIQIECNPTDALDQLRITQTWYEVDSDNNLGAKMKSSDSFEKGKTYALSLALKTKIFRDDGNRKLDYEYFAFNSKSATIDGTKCTGTLFEQTDREREYYGDVNIYHYKNTELYFIFRITTDGDYPLLGSVSYDGEARYGEIIYGVNVDLITDIPLYKLHPQWQVEEDGEWKDLAGETTARLEISGADKRYLVGKNIRMSYTADGYRDGIYGAAKKVEKRSTVSLKPDAPELSYENMGNQYRIYINNYNGDEQSYYYMIYNSSNSPITSAPVSIDSNMFTIERTSQDQIVKVSTSFMLTAWQEPSSSISEASMLVPALITGTSARSLIYPEYDNTLNPKVYIPTGGSITIKYMISPVDATANLPTWKPVYYGSEKIVDVHPSVSFEQVPGEGYIVLTAGNTATTTTVSAYRPDGVTPWYYGNDYSAMGRSITVVIYDPDDISSIPTPENSRTINLCKGESYTLSRKTLKTFPLVKDGINIYLNPEAFSYEAAIYKTTMHGYEYVEANEYVSVNNTSDGISINANEIGNATVHIFAVNSRSRRDIAQINVNVTSNGGANISGNVTSFGNAADEVTIKLLKPNGNVVHEQKLSGNTAKYHIDDVVAGSYTMVVSKKSHVTQTYELSVGTANVTQDVKIWLLGDVNCDGVVSNADLVMMARYIVGLDTNTDVEEYGDMNNDRAITNVDVVSIARTIVGLE